MRIMYFLDPKLELDNINFRLGTIRNHIEHELKSLIKEGNEVFLLLGMNLYQNARLEGLLDNIKCIRINERIYNEMIEKKANYESLAFNKTAVYKEKFEIEKYLRRKVGKVSPDIIVAYESVSSNILRKVFPNTLVLESMLSGFSRSPYPEMSIYDPVGIYKNSIFSNIVSINDYNFSINNENLICEIKEKVKSSFSENCSYSIEKYKNVFKRVILLPLQIDNYFAVSENLDDLEKKDNCSIIKHVLSILHPDDALIVTLHPADKTTICNEEFREIIKTENVIYDEDLNNLRWASQYLMSQVDAIVCITSSLGAHSLIFDKPLFHISSNQYSFFSFNFDKGYRAIVDNYSTNYNSKILALLLGDYYHYVEKINSAEGYLTNFFSRSLEFFKTGGDWLDFFIPDENYLNIKLSEFFKYFRKYKMLEEISKFNSEELSMRIAEFKSIKKMIDDADVVSFDIFDTLLIRPLINQNGVFYLMENDARTLFLKEKIDLKKFGSFADLRSRAATRVRRNTKGEEIDFDSIYSEIKKISGITKDTAELLKDLEIKYEFNLLRPRKFGRAIYEYAKNNKKEIVYCSDMYLKEKDILNFLSKCGYEKQEIFLSSKMDALKKTGKLFEILRENKSGKRIIHLGDNFESDVIQAEKKGIHAIYIPNNTETFKSSLIMQASNIGLSKINDQNGLNILYGLLSRKFYDNKILNSMYDGSAYNLGYSGCAPIIYSFVKWLIEQSNKDGVTDLYFLARDGKIVKDVYDKVISSGVKGPKSHYLLASRRCFNTASLFNEEDLFSSLNLAFSEMNITDFLKNRFDISINSLKKDTLKIMGIDNYNYKINIKRKSDRNKLKKLMSHNKELILGYCKSERTALIQYLNGSNIFNATKPYVVDIGHNATLQASLAKILTTKNLGGYYFATFYGAKEIYLDGLDVKGYLLNFEDNHLSNHTYCSHIGMFEMIFLTNQPSFKKFNLMNGTLLPEFVEGDEKNRFELVEKIHNGILDFVKDLIRYIPNHINNFELSTHQACENYFNFILNPSFDDAKIFENVSFVDMFGGKAERHLIALKEFPYINEENYNEYLKASWWKEGAMVLANQQSSSLSLDLSTDSSIKLNLTKNIFSQRNHLKLFNIIFPTNLISELPLNESHKRKLRKLLRNPSEFVKDSVFLKSFLK